MGRDPDGWIGGAFWISQVRLKHLRHFTNVIFIEKYLDYYNGTLKKGCIDLNLMKNHYTVNYIDSKFVFAIEAKKCYQFSCRSAQERDRWMEALSILSADRNILETQILDFFTSQIDKKNGKISLEQTMSFFVTNNIRPPASLIQRLFEVSNKSQYVF